MTENDCCRGRLATGPRRLISPFPAPGPHALNRRRMHCSPRSGSNSRSARRSNVRPTVETRETIAGLGRRRRQIGHGTRKYGSRAGNNRFTICRARWIGLPTDSSRKIESDIGQPSRCRAPELSARTVRSLRFEAVKVSQIA